MPVSLYWPTMEIAFLGAARTVTGSCFMMTVGSRRFMVDCGVYQGLPVLEELNYTRPPVRWSEIDAILLTHAHIDHAGLIPRAVKLGFKGKIYAHPATIDLAEILLQDSANLQEQDAEWLNRKRMRAGKAPVDPLYSKSDVLRALRRFQRVEYEDLTEVLPGVTAEYHDAGHILGSASIAVDCVEGDLKRRIVFSGDIGHHQAPILREPLGFESADAVLIESTYGDRRHDPPPIRLEVLRDIIRQANRRNSKVVIPSFAVGRTQELLYILSRLLEDGEIPNIPIYLDSPMAISATEVHEKHPECFDDETMQRIKDGDNPFHPLTLILSRTSVQSKAINRRKGAMVIIAGGGMCEGGRIVHHLKHSLYGSENFLVFVGYQAAGTLGSVIQNGQKRVRLFGEEIAVNAKIVTIDAFSAHADSQGLIDWLKCLEKPPQMVFVVHGDEKPGEALSEAIRSNFGYTAYMPRLEQKIDLAALDKVADGKRVFVTSRTPADDDVRQMAARMGIKGEEFRPVVEGYVANLGKRIAGEQGPGTAPLSATQGIPDAIHHLADAVGGDMDKLRSLINLPSGSRRDL
jgi:metallo-beta-lactamase family protein